MVQDRAGDKPEDIPHRVVKNPHSRQKLTDAERSERYLRQKGKRCPVCQNLGVDPEKPTRTKKDWRMFAECEHCQSSWEVTCNLTVTGIADIKEGE